MAEETLSEALSNLNDEQIDKAALPENKRVEEDVSEESTYVELTEEEAESLSPVTDDSVQEDFEASQDSQESQEEGDLSEVEKRAKTARSRINQAVKQAKDFQRRELQALQYAKQLLEQNQQLSNQLSYSQNSAVEDQLKVQENYTDEFENRVDAQADAAKSIMQKAYDSGDQEALVDAQQLLARAEADRSSLNQYKQQLDDYKKNLETYNTQQQELAQQAQQMPQQAPQQAQEPVYTEPSDRAKKWATDNEWFGSNRGLTNVAFEVHQELAQSGIDTESDQYYSQLDNGIKQKVSDLTNSFNPNTNAGNGRQPVQTVVSTTRTTGNGRSQNDRRIELTPSEQQLAQRLGVPFKEYAKQKMRLQQS
jgi:tRNA/tmRNA/rRNA uracil-C5-methylase (TrmA/RlmC/RlmD family)